MSAASPAALSVAVLTNLDGYMAAAGYDTAHPWRSEIAAALAIPAPIPSQCPIHHATSALDSIEWGISVIDEVASMVDGIHAISELSLDGVTLAKLKKRMTSLNRMALLTVRFADGRSDILGEIRDQAQETVEKLNLSLSECWMSAQPGTMPPAEQTVIGWDGTNSAPRAVFFDPAMAVWILSCDPSTICKGDITHWRYCNAPGGIGSEGATS